MCLGGSPEPVAQLRQRLSSRNWFMGRLNEFIARAAIKEDGQILHLCSGGRYQTIGNPLSPKELTVWMEAPLVLKKMNWV